MASRTLQPEEKHKLSDNVEQYFANNPYEDAPYEETAESVQEMSPEDQELAARIEARRRLTKRSNTRKKRRTTVMIILVFAVLLTMCSREIVKLKAQNYELQKQHAQLEQERDRLTKELGRVGDKEYIKEQARKQLKLLDPGEIMFVFDDGKGSTEDNTEEDGN